MIKIITSFCGSQSRLYFANPYSFATDSEKFIDKFSELLSQNPQYKQVIHNGRPWKANQLRLKSNEDLHKLWYVMVREKNVLLSDRITLKRVGQGLGNTKPRLEQVRKSMKRILGVVAERQQIRKKYRQQLEEEYILKKKEELQKQVAQKQPLPDITMEMLRAKYHDLKRGVDNVKYLERIYDHKEKRAEDRERMHQRLEKSKPQNFKSFWEYETSIGERPLQEEVLRAHIKNWKTLNLKQRKIILGFLNARRAKDAKSSFIKELKILGQKIAYDQTKERIASS